MLRKTRLKFVKFLFFLLLFVKIILFFSIKFYYKILYIGGVEAGNDSIYYHLYAIGAVDHAVNLWPVILRFLNSYGFYNRDYVSIFLFTTSVFFLPFAVASLVRDNRYIVTGELNKFVYWIISFVILIYPTIFFLSLDIYRDIAMYSFFCIFLLFVKHILLWKKYIYIILLLPSGYILYMFRPYLGFSLGCAFFFFKLNTKRVLVLIPAYLIFIFMLKISGYLDPILMYRGEEGFETGGSSFGIGLLYSDNLTFMYLYIYSILIQLFGLIFNNWKAVAVFATESFIFILFFIYVVRNIKYTTPFLEYIAFFFVIYGSIWCLGNDNLGTAVRLRVFNYISIYVMAGTIYLEKETVKKENYLISRQTA